VGFPKHSPESGSRAEVHRGSPANLYKFLGLLDDDDLLCNIAADDGLAADDDLEWLVQHLLGQRLQLRQHEQATRHRQIEADTKRNQKKEEGEATKEGGDQAEGQIAKTGGKGTGWGGMGEERKGRGKNVR